MRPREYSIGSFDVRFGIAPTEFLSIIRDAEAVWEQHAEFDLFSHNQDAQFSVNLLFSENQEGIFEAQRLGERENELASENAGIDELRTNYEGLAKDYEKRLDVHERSIDVFNERVAGWNSRGGAPEGVFEELRKEEERLKNELNAIERDRLRLNRLSDQINQRIRSINAEIVEFNSEIRDYEQEFDVGREFDQGTFFGDRIDIYSFEDREDLVLVLAHELGHWLGIDHVDDNHAVMHYLLADQDMENISLTLTDQAALRKVCHFQ